LAFVKAHGGAAELGRCRRAARGGNVELSFRFSTFCWRGNPNHVVISYEYNKIALRADSRGANKTLKRTSLLPACTASQSSRPVPSLSSTLSAQYKQGKGDKL
jgi:hypothetical protein